MGFAWVVMAALAGTVPTVDGGLPGPMLVLFLACGAALVAVSYLWRGTRHTIVLDGEGMTLLGHTNWRIVLPWRDVDAVGVVRPGVRSTVRLLAVRPARNSSPRGRAFVLGPLPQAPGWLLLRLADLSMWRGPEGEDLVTAARRYAGRKWVGQAPSWDRRRPP